MRYLRCLALVLFVTLFASVAVNVKAQVADPGGPSLPPGGGSGSGFPGGPELPPDEPGCGDFI